MPSLVGTAVVTGATGFLGSEIVRQLLLRGYHVRAAVRSVSGRSTGYLEALATALPGSVELHIADLQSDADWNKLTEGARYIFHTATPGIEFAGRGDAVRTQLELIDPMVEVAKAMIRAAARAKVRRVVITSENFTMDCFGSKTGLINDEQWNESLDLVHEGYTAMKVTTERTAWDLAQELSVDLVTIHPSVMLGPVLNRRGGSSVEIVQTLLEGKPWDLPYGMFNDMQGNALAQIHAAELPAAKGRYLLTELRHTPIPELIEALRAAFPEIDFADVPPEYVDFHKRFAPVDPASVARCEADLGIKLTPAVVSVVDQARSLIALRMAEPKLKG